MKLIGIFLLHVFAAIHSPLVFAALEPRLGGQAYYDTVLNITWLADANAGAGSPFDEDFDFPMPGGTNDGLMSWANAMAWANSVEVNGVSGWRLPKVRPIDDVAIDVDKFSANGTADTGYGVTGIGWITVSGEIASEMGFMYYVNLGNLAICGPDAIGLSCSPEQSGGGLRNSGPFHNVIESSYWSGTENTAGDALVFAMGGGSAGAQGNEAKSWLVSAWAVHDGDVALVPLPASVSLFCGGVALLVRCSRSPQNRLRRGSQKAPRNSDS